MKFLLIFMLVWLIASVIIFFPLGNRRYVCLFDHSLWKGWKNVINHFNTIEYNGYFEYYLDPTLENHSFIITIGDKKCKLVYWIYYDTVSVHNYIDPKEDCLCHFDKYHCKIVKDLLCEKFDFIQQYK